MSGNNKKRLHPGGPVLLINPPVAKPCEPPAGVARLAMALKSCGHNCRVYDANLEGLLHLLSDSWDADDRWSRRALGNVSANLARLRSPLVYGHPDRYKRAVNDLNRVLQLAGQDVGARITLSNFSTPALSPVRSQDLLQAAENFETNPFYPQFRDRLRSLFAEAEPAIIGISINFLNQAICGFAMAGFIRNELPGARIVLGGGLVTSWMHLPGFAHPFGGLVDDLIAGPGEAHLLAMCGPGDARSFPPAGFDYSPFPQDSYLSPGPILPYSASRGCYWQKCRFCPERSEKSSYEPTDPQTVQNDLERLVRESRPRLIHFLDNALSPRLMKCLIEHPPGAMWYGFARITEHLTNPLFVQGLKRSGCIMLKLGIESGDQAVLNALQKGTDLMTASRALHALKGAGIGVYAYLLFGTPAETLSSARKTLSFTLSHSASIDFLNLAIFNLPVASREAQSLSTQEFYGGDLSLYREFAHPGGWNRGQVRHFLAREFTKPAPLRRILHRNPATFTSNHAPFLLATPAT